MRLKERRTIVTGAGSGIGRATSLLFAQEGSAVLVSDVDEASGEETVARIRAGGGTASFCRADVSDSEEVQALVRTAVERLGGVDILVNNAGVGSTETLAETSEELWQLVMDVNLTGTFLCSKYAIPLMLEQGHGNIINIASVAGMVGIPERAAYCASKAGIIGLTKAAAVDHAAEGLRVNAICPGTVDSPWVQRLLNQAEDPAAARASLIARQPQGRLGTPEEIAQAALYLASPESAYVTGSCLVIDGALTAG